MHRFVAIVALLLSTVCLAEEPTDPPPVDPPIRTSDRATRDYAVIIGNESYTSLPHATYAQADAVSFRDYFRRTRGMSRYRTRQVANRSSRQIRQELRRALYRVGRGGTIWVVFTGHGSATPGGMDHALLGTDATIDDVVEGAVEGGVPLTEVADTLLGSNKAERIIVVIDAAFGGTARDGMRLADDEPSTVPAFTPPDSDRITIWSAAIGHAPAGVYPPVGHGLFSYLVLGALRGWADGEITGDRDGTVSLTEAQHYVAWTARQMGRPTRPSMEGRPGVQQWALSKGDHLEAAPADADMIRLGERDRRDRIDRAGNRIRAEAAAFWPDTLAEANAGGAEGRAALESFIDAYGSASIHVELAVSVPEVAAARHRLARWGAPPVADPQATEPDLRCNDMLGLQKVAMLGRLVETQLDCLENRLTTERLQTTKDKVSRMLIVNAQALGDVAGWDLLIRRHLEDIDRSDPDMCMGYGIHLYKQEDADEEAIRWADVALENKHNWSGSTYVKRVNGLLRLRAEAAYRIWTSAENKLAEDPNDERESVSREFRGWAMDNAREWLDYVRASGLNARTAMDLCKAAAGHERFCAGG